MRRSAATQLLVLFAALLAGVLPLYRCDPNDACRGGVVVLGVHLAHDHGPDVPDDPASDEAACVDTPIDGSLPAAVAALDAPALAPDLAAVARGSPGLASVETARAVVPGDGVPRGTRTTVLLR